MNAPNLFGELAVGLLSDSFATGSDVAAVAEIVPRAGRSDRSSTLTRATFPIAVNGAPHKLNVAPGDYTVRLFLPSGSVMAESVSVQPQAQQAVNFELRRSPHEWLGPESLFGSVQSLPTLERANGLAALDKAVGAMSDAANLAAASSAPVLRGANASASPALSSPSKLQQSLRNASVMVSQAKADLESGCRSVEQISGPSNMPKISGRRRLSQIDRQRGFPPTRITTQQLIEWWIGPAEPASSALKISVHDERNAKLVTAGDTLVSDAFITGERRAIAEVTDPTGIKFFAVLPECWRRTSKSKIGTPAATSVLLTVVIDSIMRSSHEQENAARWRCSTAVDDYEVMAFLGFLYAGQQEAADTLLKDAQDLLFDKIVNPVAAAAGALGLVTYADKSNSQQRPQWRNWVRNLYSLFPALPDAAIAMAQMYLRYGDGDTGVANDEELDVEKLRTFALEAARRGLPYLTYGINPLTEILQQLVSDDEIEKRQGEAVEMTRRAYYLTKRLGRLIEPTEFFTVLRVDPNAT